MEVTRTVEGGLLLSQSLEEFKDYLPAKDSKFNSTETPSDYKIRLHKNGLLGRRRSKKKRGLKSVLLVFPIMR